MPSRAQIARTALLLAGSIAMSTRSSVLAVPESSTLVNLAPGPNDTFGLIAAEAEVLEEPATTTMGDCIRGWIRPACPLGDFLEAYSRLGGTHHSALVYGDRVKAVEAFARFAGIGVNTIC